MKFSEHDDAFEIRIPFEKDSKVRWRIFILMVVFLFLIFSIIKNDYSLVFGKSKKADFFCSESAVSQPSDDFEYSLEKAQKVLGSNQEKLEKIEGYVSSRIFETTTGYNNNKKRAGVEMVFENSQTGNEMPSQICGFEVKVINK